MQPGTHSPDGAAKRRGGLRIAHLMQIAQNHDLSIMLW
jgi:hypothetical protein